MNDADTTRAERVRVVGSGVRGDFVRRGGWWVVGQSILMAGVVMGGVVGRDQWISTPGFALGCALFAIGGGVGVLGVVGLGRARTAFPRPRSDGRLVTTGIYGWVRHPLYFSVITASVGWGLIWGSAVAVALAGVLGGFLAAKAEREERWLREVYPDYASYAKRVKRLVPGLY